uniref:Cilia- and flagella-associated protein 299 n=1 Tax=Guillardia theta TaxID=55529 RepID=A0A7S4KYF0_GUITH
MAEAELTDFADDALKFETYEQYLDSQISPMDIYYLEDQDLARDLVELGYRGSGETLKREEFEARKKAAEEAKASKLRNAPKKLASADKDLSHFPFLHSLAEREDLVRNGKLTSIIFLRDKNSKGQEVSGYIDYAHRLKTEDFEPYFDRKKKLMPKPSDLSYYNWETQHSTSNSTPNFQVLSCSQENKKGKERRRGCEGETVERWRRKGSC